VRLGANVAPSKPQTRGHVAGDSAPNELRHAALSGTAPTSKPEGLQGRRCSNPVSTELPTDGPQATHIVEACAVRDT